MAGKSSTAKELVKQLQTAGVAVELLKETTTRPKRESDYENPEYHFVTEKEFNQKEFLTSANFKVTSGETWRYGIEIQEFPELGVIVSNMYAIDTLLCNGIPEDLDVKIFYLNISEEEALKRDKGDRLSQAGDVVVDRIKRDISNYNMYYEKHEDYIYAVDCDDTTLEEVVDYIYYILRRDECGLIEYDSSEEEVNSKSDFKTCFLCVLVTFALTIAAMSWYNNMYGKKVIIVNENTIELEECPLCDGNAKLNPVNDSYYIECKKCGLQTGYYGSLDMLVNYWNDRQ